MRKLLLCALICALLLAGCSHAPAQTPTPPATAAPTQTPSPTAEPTAEPDPSPTDAPEDARLKELREWLQVDGSVLGAAYLGVCPAEAPEDLLTYVDGQGFTQEYPWLRSLPVEQIVLQPGSEVYLLVPALETTSLTVRDFQLEGGSGQVLAAAPAGAPVLLCGNVSEVVPNLLVTAVPAEGDAIEYQPCLSLRDGSLAPAERVTDLTPYGALGITPELYGDHPWAGAWSAATAETGMYYDLILWETGACEFAVGLPGQEAAVRYEGWWWPEEEQLCLDLVLAWGAHPESPEMETLYGSYRVEQPDADALTLTFVSGSILTQDMEASTKTSFRR